MREPERDLGRLMDILQAAPSYSRVHSTSDAINQSKTLYLPAQLVGHIIRQFLAGGERFEGPDFLCCLAIDFAGTVTFVIGFATANGEHTDEEEKSNEDSFHILDGFDYRLKEMRMLRTGITGNKEMRFHSWVSVLYRSMIGLWRFRML